MRLPWTVQAFLKYRRILPTRSFLRLRSALVAERAGTVGFRDAIDLQLRRPLSAAIRVRPRSNDIYTIDEVLLDQVYAAAVARAGDARTVLDLGANIGLASLYLAAALPKARVFAVEPDADNARLLRHNLAGLVAAGRATVRRAAVWDRDTPVAFLPPDSIGHVNQGTVCAVDQLATPPDPANVCPGYTLPTLFAEAGFDTVDLLKIDVEGAEVGLFAGCGGWLPRVKVLAVEFHGSSRQESGFDAAVREHGFRVTDESPHTVVACRGAA